MILTLVDSTAYTLIQFHQWDHASTYGNSEMMALTEVETLDMSEFGTSFNSYSYGSDLHRCNWACPGFECMAAVTTYQLSSA